MILGAQILGFWNIFGCLRVLHPNCLLMKTYPFLITLRSVETKVQQVYMEQDHIFNIRTCLDKWAPQLNIAV